jgi:predicted DCC family thiol-disulfide oxidoreductase YuxK
VVAATAPHVDPELVLYDGTCGLCAKSVRWILHHERDHDLKFAPLQGETVQALRARYPNIPATVDTVIYIANGKAYLRSKAFLHAAKHLRAPWRWAFAFRWFPGFLLNVGYRFIAAIRYKVWGRVDACELPSPEQRARFLP